MRIGGRLNKLPHDRENYLPVYFRDSSPARTSYSSHRSSLFVYNNVGKASRILHFTCEDRASGGELSSVSVCAGQEGWPLKTGDRAHFTWHKCVTCCLPVDLSMPRCLLQLEKVECIIWPQTKVLFALPSDRLPVLMALNIEIWMNGGKDGLQDSLQARTVSWSQGHSGPSSWPSPPACPPLGTLSLTFQAVARQGGGVLGQAVSVWSSLLMETGRCLGLCSSLQKRKKVKQGDWAEKEIGWGGNEEVVEPNQENFLPKGK